MFEDLKDINFSPICPPLKKRLRVRFIQIIKDIHQCCKNNNNRYCYRLFLIFVLHFFFWKNNENNKIKKIEKICYFRYLLFSLFVIFVIFFKISKITKITKATKIQKSNKENFVIFAKICYFRSLLKKINEKNITKTVVVILFFVITIIVILLFLQSWYRFFFIYPSFLHCFKLLNLSTVFEEL